MHTVSFKPPALQDLEEILNYYDQVGHHVSQTFERKVFSVLENVARYPQMYTPVTDEVRRCKISGFP